MKEIRSSKILMILLVCIVIGLVLPYLVMHFSGKLVLLTGALGLFALLLLLRKGWINVYDWLILFFIAIPFHDFRIMFGTFYLRLTELFFMPFFVWASVQIFRSRIERKNLWRLNREYVILLFFYAFSLMSIAFSGNPFISTYRTAVLLYLILMSFMVSKILKEQDKIKLIVKAMIAISAVASVYAIMQSFLPALHPFMPVRLTSLGFMTIYRSGLGWQNPNYFALYISMILPITYICKISKVFPEKRFLNICFVLQAMGLFSSYSRLGFISIAITFLFLLWIRGKRNMAIILFIILIVLSVVAFLSMEYIYVNNPYLAATIFRIPNLGEVLKNPLLIAGWRRDAWIANINMFLAHPFFGVGPFMSTAMYAEYRPHDQVYPLQEGLAAHNEYLSLLSERGVFGTALFLVFLFFLATRAMVFYKNNKSSAEGKLMLGLWASVINFIFFSFGGATIYSVQFWINVGIILALYNATKNKIKDNDLSDGALDGK